MHWGPVDRNDTKGGGNIQIPTGASLHDRGELHV